ADDVALTELLQRAGRGDGDAADRLLPRVYSELQRLARARMARERRDHTLQPTALVHEAYLHLLGDARLEWPDRARFFQAAAEAMRRILVDHARRRARHKRGGGRERAAVDVAELAGGSVQDPDTFLALDEAIQRLERADPRAAEVVRLRFFGGL